LLREERFAMPTSLASIARASLVCIAVAAASAAVGCSTSEVEPTAESDAAIRAMLPEEIVGQILYGETIDVDYKPAPRYRAFWFNGQRGDQIQAQVVSHDMTDPVMWLADDSWNTLSVNNDTRVNDLNALISGRTLPKTGKYWVIFRELNSAPRAKLSLTLRLLGRLPVDCDPNGEGIALPECIDPLEYDPFSPTSCQGTALTATTAKTKFGVEGGFRLGEARIFYRTRQCRVVGAGTDCSPWVRAFGMDVRMAKISAPVAAPEGPAPAANTWTFGTVDTARKVKVDFSVQPTATTQYCVDGPFTNLRGDDWQPLADGTPGGCSAATAVVTSTCTRIEPKTVQVESGNPAYFTEFGAVLYARY
jgi:hypothetical protein